MLIGFSGNDQNFLEWIGWIRDELDDHHAPIYLGQHEHVGSESRCNVTRSLLTKRGVTPIDLSYRFFPGNLKQSPATAIQWFLENLQDDEAVLASDP